MFERYTEKARRAIFFARYETSQFGSPYIEAEHLTLGLLREDKALAIRFLRSHAGIESIRKAVEAHTSPREKVSTSLDLPLSHECKRVLAYGAEEAQRLDNKHIGTPHLLLGLLREENSFAAQLLREQGVTLDSVREEVRHSEPPVAQRGPAFMVGLDRWLAEREADGSTWTVEREGFANGTTHFVLYAGDPRKENENSNDRETAEKLAQMQQRIDFIVGRMEHAIANHEFEKSRFYSDEERKERENLRLLRKQLNWEEPPPRVPLLCIKIIGDDLFSDVQKRCDEYIAQGVAQVWILDPRFKRAYTVTGTEGLREFKGKILQNASPPARNGPDDDL
jgi:Clp amino terminal domain, pathogenicity island component